MYVLEKRTSVLPFFVAVTDVRSGYGLRTNLSVSIDDIFCGGQCKKTHRTSCVKFLRADTDLRTETKFKSIGESGGCVDIYAGCVDFIEELLRVGITFGDDRFRVTGIVAVDMGDCLLHGIYGLHGDDIVQVLFPPVFFGCSDCVRNQFADLLIAADLHVFFL